MMRSPRIAFAAIIGALAASANANSPVIVQVQRVDQDLYFDQSSGVYIKTQFCFSFHIGEAVIKINGPNGIGMGKIWFEDQTVCEVIGLYSQKPTQ